MQVCSLARDPNLPHLVQLRRGCLQPARTVLCMQLRQALMQATQLQAQLAQRCLLLLLCCRCLLSSQLRLRCSQLAPNGLQLCCSSSGTLLRCVGCRLCSGHCLPGLLQLRSQLHLLLA